MGDHLVLCVDRLVTPESLQSLDGAEAAGSSGEGSSHSAALEPNTCAIDIEAAEEQGSSEEEPLLQMVECRICQEEDNIKNLETPCACSGSLKVLIYLVLASNRCLKHFNAYFFLYLYFIYLVKFCICMLLGTA